MATLADHQIRYHAMQWDMIAPYEPSQLNPASYDVRLGKDLLVEGKNAYGERWFPYFLQHKPYIMEPGEFVLGVIEEFIRVPNDVECQFMMKSSLGREGLDHINSCYIDPGYMGSITLELVNVNRSHSIQLSQGMLIGQLKFSRLEAPVETPYGVKGHYQGDINPEPAKLNGCVIT